MDVIKQMKERKLVKTEEKRNLNQIISTLIEKVRATLE